MEAVKWWRKAAEQNDADAQSDLAVCYAKGQGVAKNEAQAYKWVRLAAARGNKGPKEGVTILKGPRWQITGGSRLITHFRLR